MPPMPMTEHVLLRRTYAVAGKSAPFLVARYPSYKVIHPFLDPAANLPYDLHAKAAAVVAKRRFVLTRGLNPNLSPACCPSAA
jgi:hypothetical protein